MLPFPNFFRLYITYENLKNDTGSDSIFVIRKRHLIQQNTEVTKMLDIKSSM